MSAHLPWPVAEDPVAEDPVAEDPVAEDPAAEASPPRWASLLSPYASAERMATMGTHMSWYQ
jgi:hypothetical protein